jgi:hypothetical protein
MDKAKIFVYRRVEASPFRPVLAQLLFPLKMELLLDGMPAGTTVPSSYTVLTVRPGPHTIVSRYGGEDADLTVYAAGGWIYYVSQEMYATDSLTGSELHLMDRETGREQIASCTRIKDPPPPLDPPPGRPNPPPPAAPRLRQKDQGAQ